MNFKRDKFPPFSDLNAKKRGGGGANHQVIRHCLTLWKFDFKHYRTLMSELYNDVEMDK